MMMALVSVLEKCLGVCNPNDHWWHFSTGSSHPHMNVSNYANTAVAPVYGLTTAMQCVFLNWGCDFDDDDDVGGDGSTCFT